jgi:nitrite reductase/ring-hydroxylating ferredoxin subunit
MLNPESPLTNRAVDRLAKWGPLATVAEAWQGVVTAILRRTDRRTTDLLRGTPLGHPLHPAITDIPIGAWSVTAVLDAASLAGAGALEPGADVALAVGLGGAVLAAASGWAEWSDTQGEPRTLGMAHASLNGAALTAYAASLAMRRNGRRGAGIGLAMLGYGFLLGGAFLGGELSFGMQLGVKHAGAPIDPPDDFVPATAASAVAEGHMKRVTVNELPILLYRKDGEVYAISAICSHRGAPLDEGTLSNGCVQCPWHGSIFKLDSGEVVQGPAAFPQARYETRTVDGTIEIRATR